MKKATLLTQNFGGSTIKTRPANQPEAYEQEPLYPTGFRVELPKREYLIGEDESLLLPTTPEEVYKIPIVTDDSVLYPTECKECD